MSRSGPKTRKPAPLARTLHRDLTNYAVAAGAAGVSVVALAQPTNAQIVYTPAHEMMGSRGKISIDLNHDGAADVMIREIPCSAGTFFPANSLQAVPLRAGGAFREGIYGWPVAAMAAGSKIGPGEFFFAGVGVMLNWTYYGVYYFGSWAFAPTSYLGIRFSIKGENHYGWARLKAAYNFYGRDIDVLLTGYAYESKPNTPILAGATGKDAGADDPASQEPRSTLPRLKSPTLGALALGRPLLSRCGS